jgi:hypothetical protein
MTAGGGWHRFGDRGRSVTTKRSSRGRACRQGGVYRATLEASIPIRQRRHVREPCFDLAARPPRPQHDRATPVEATT